MTPPLVWHAFHPVLTAYLSATTDPSEQHARIETNVRRWLRPLADEPLTAFDMALMTTKCYLSHIPTLKTHEVPVLLNHNSPAHQRDMARTLALAVQTSFCAVTQAVAPPEPDSLTQYGQTGLLIERSPQPTPLGQLHSLFCHYAEEDVFYALMYHREGSTYSARLTLHYPHRPARRLRLTHREGMMTVDPEV